MLPLYQGHAKLERRWGLGFPDTHTQTRRRWEMIPVVHLGWFVRALLTQTTSEATLEKAAVKHNSPEDTNKP